MELYYRLEQYNACMHHNIPPIGCISVQIALLTVISDQPVIKNSSLTFLMLNQPHSLPTNHPTMSLIFSKYYFCITVHITFLLLPPLCRELHCRHTLLIFLWISSSAETLHYNWTHLRHGAENQRAVVSCHSSQKSWACHLPTTKIDKVPDDVRVGGTLSRLLSPEILRSLDLNMLLTVVVTRSIRMTWRLWLR